MILHTVKRGETLSAIARHYGTTVRRLTLDNGLQAGDPLVVGQAVAVLYPKTVHTVRAGESLWTIAAAYGVPLNELYRNNPGLLGQAYLRPGEQLVIAFTQQRLGAAEILGYAYPSVDKTLLRDTLPYISSLMPFTYEFNANGSLRPLDDETLIALANERGVAPLMHLSNLREPVGFDSELSHALLGDPRAQTRLIEEVWETVRRRSYRGVDVDFENVYARDAKLLADFLRRLRTKLSPAGYEVLAALTAKTADDNKGLLYEGHDYAAVGAAVDGVLLMTYEWGYRYGPPMAVAPIAKVRETLDYAVTRIPPGKLFVGIPNYGYDWQLPFVQGTTGAQSLSNVRAVQLAGEYGAEIQYSGESQAPYFHYRTADGTAHVVWFEDVKSIRVKLELIAAYGLRGAGYWNLMRPFPGNWSVLNALYAVTQ